MKIAEVYTKHSYLVKVEVKCVLIFLILIRIRFKNLQNLLEVRFQSK
jgi:hypothetical protein